MTLPSRVGADVPATSAAQVPFVASTSPTAQLAMPLVSWLQQGQQWLNNCYTKSTNTTMMCGVPYQPPQLPEYGKQQTFNAYHQFLQTKGKT